MNDKFSNGLVGKWATSEGIFTMMYDEFNFDKDGLCTWLSQSGMGEELFRFTWRSVAPFKIEMKHAIDDDNDDDEHWFPIEYEFKEVVNDISKAVILCQKGSDRFYMASTMISFVTG